MELVVVRKSVPCIDSEIVFESPKDEIMLEFNFWKGSYVSFPTTPYSIDIGYYIHDHLSKYLPVPSIYLNPKRTFWSPSSPSTSSPRIIRLQRIVSGTLYINYTTLFHLTVGLSTRNQVSTHK